MLVKYDSNNSGGNWWLSDQNWKDLEAAGWKVDWFKDRKDDVYTSLSRDGEGYWLGALARSAEIEVQDPADAMRQFETITGQSVSEEGCNCCGAPHSFTWTDAEGRWNYAAGQECLPYLYGQNIGSLRDAYELLAGKE